MLFVAVGDPIVDVVVNLDYDDAHSLLGKYTPGEWCLVSGHDMKHLLTRLDNDKVIQTRECGGSAANTCKTVGALVKNATYWGVIGHDDLGGMFENHMLYHNVKCNTIVSLSQPSNTCLCVVTPDGQRTMRTCLDASAEFEMSHALSIDFSGCKIFHMTAYFLSRGENVVMTLLQNAKNKNALVSYSLAAQNAVKSNRNVILNILKLGLVDIISGNVEEFDTLGIIPNTCIAFVTDGPKGCTVYNKGHAICHVDAVHVETVIDTVGAGDICLGAFLASYIKGMELDECTRIACKAGAYAVMNKGSTLAKHEWMCLLRALE